MNATYEPREVEQRQGQTYEYDDDDDNDGDELKKTRKEQVIRLIRSRCSNMTMISGRIEVREVLNKFSAQAQRVQTY